MDKYFTDLASHKNFKYLNRFAIIEFNVPLLELMYINNLKISYSENLGDNAALFSPFKEEIFLTYDSTLSDFVHELFHYLNWKKSKIKYLFYMKINKEYKYKSQLYKNIYKILPPTDSGRYDVNGEGYIAEWLLNASEQMIKTFLI